MWNISYTYLAKKLKSYILILLTKGCTKNHERFSSLVHDLWLSYFNILALMQFWCTGLISIWKVQQLRKSSLFHTSCSAVSMNPRAFLFDKIWYTFMLFSRAYLTSRCDTSEQCYCIQQNATLLIIVFWNEFLQWKYFLRRRRYQ